MKIGRTARVGANAYLPTKEERIKVKFAYGLGITEQEICQCIRTPEGRPVSLSTLRKRFKNERESGYAELKMNVRLKISQLALRARSEQTALNACRYLENTRFNVRETSALHVSGANGAAIEYVEHADSAADDSRIRKLTTLLDAARARRDGSLAIDCGPADLVSDGGAAGTST